MGNGSLAKRLTSSESLAAGEIQVDLKDIDKLNGSIELEFNLKFISNCHCHAGCQWHSGPLEY